MGKAKKTLANKPFFERFASWVSKATGTSVAFAIALLIIIVWAAIGPIFHFSELWQLFINTGTTIITFLIVFVIQKAQNKDSLAIQLKLNELVAASDLASNRMISVEDLTEDELRYFKNFTANLPYLQRKKKAYMNPGASKMQNSSPSKKTEAN